VNRTDKEPIGGSRGSEDLCREHGKQMIAREREKGEGLHPNVSKKRTHGREGGATFHQGKHTRDNNKREIELNEIVGGEGTANGAVVILSRN